MVQPTAFDSGSISALTGISIILIMSLFPTPFKQIGILLSTLLTIIISLQVIGGEIVITLPWLIILEFVSLICISLASWFQVQDLNYARFRFGTFSLCVLALGSIGAFINTTFHYTYIWLWAYGIINA